MDRVPSVVHQVVAGMMGHQTLFSWFHGLSSGSCSRHTECRPETGVVAGDVAASLPAMVMQTMLPSVVHQVVAGLVVTSGVD